MDDNFGEWVESMGVASGRSQEAGVASGWNLWVWLECIGVVSGWCCTEVHRYPHNDYYFPYSTCISFFGAEASLLLCSFLKCFFVLVYVIFVQYIAFEIVKNRDNAKIINYIDK